MSLLPPVGQRLLPVLAGLLLASAHPPAAFLLPAFVGLVPLLVFIAERPPGVGGRWEATRGGLLTGVVYFGVQLYWIGVALLPRSPLALPAYLLMVAVLAGLTGGFAWALHYARERTPIPLALLAAIFWTAAEWLQGNLGPIAFPWLGLGTALAPFPRLAGAADLVGARGLGFWLAAVNGLVATGILRAREGRPVATLAATAVVVAAAPMGYGLARAATLELRPAARIALVQPDIADDLRRGPAAVETAMAALSRLTRSLAPGSVDLVAWPEVAVPARMEQDPALVDAVRALSREIGAPIVAGTYGAGRTGGPTTSATAAGPVFNSAVIATGEGVSARYDKRRLVPFIERVPLGPAVARGPGTARTAGTAGFNGRLVPGDDRPARLSAGDTRYGVLICYESAFARLARDYRRDGADVLLNITNDGWYGRDTWWGTTTGLWQHPAHLVMRAIETRAGVARAANTGFSMAIDPLGRVTHRTPLFEPDVRIAEVLTTDAVTLYVRWGDWLATGSVAAALLVLLGAGTPRRPRPWDPHHPPPHSPAGPGRDARSPAARGRCPPPEVDYATTFPYTSRLVRKRTSRSI